MIGPRPIILWPLLLTPVIAAGCASRPIGTPRPVKTTAARLVPRSRPLLPAAASSGILPLGSVPFDGRSLPLVSPHGRFIATQTGVGPTWPTLLAEPAATVPAETRVEVYEILRGPDAVPARRTTLPDPMILGRSGDQTGFLVESVRPDGARWIGYARWSGGPVKWLVSDGHVNAFGSLGPAGALAWSRRAPGEDHFDLVIRRAGEQWTLGAQGGDWLNPIWSPTGAGLYALRLVQGRLEVIFVDAEGPQQTSVRQRLTLAVGMGRHDAYQTTAGGALITGVPHHGGEYLLLWHPTAMRIGLWRPLSSPAAPALLEAESIAALIERSGLALVTTPKHLIIQDPANPRDRRPLVPGPQVPRAVDRSDWPYLLMAPKADRIELMAFRVMSDEGKER